MNILILSCGTRSLLVDYFRNRTNGFDKVVATDCSPYSPALYRADKYYIVPKMKEPSYLPALFDICVSEDIHAVLPLQEDELIFIADHREEFIKREIFPIISGPEIVRLCRDKYYFANEMKKAGIPVISTYLAEDADSFLEKYGLPAFMKPRYGAGSVLSYCVREKSVIESGMNSEEKFVLQPYIKGAEYGVNAYVDFITGKLTEIFILEKIRMRSGETEKSLSVHNDKIRAIVEELCGCLDIVGPIDIDILERNGEYYCLEVNPRFGGAYPHTHECGVNFVRLLANNVADIKNEPFTMMYEDGIVALRYMTISTMKKEDMIGEQ